ncbi:MAG: amino acid permease [Gemmataceae bacterium]
MEPIQRESIPARLGLWDAVSIILGIIIGVGIFETPTRVFQQTPSAAWAIGIWVAAGLLALAGALVFAELSAAYPRSGGEYVYLTRAFGPLMGYVFAWAQLTVIRPGSIGAVAFVFASYAARLMDMGPDAIVWLAAGAVLILTLINILGVTLGKGAQNLLTLAKVLGLVAIIVFGFGWRTPPHPDPEGSLTAGVSRLALEPGWLAASTIYVLWTYAGWQEAGYVATEIRNPARNIPRALIIGTLGVTLIYVLVNLALLNSLGADGAKRTSAVSDVIANVLPTGGGQFLQVLIVISALGALNGMIFTTARIYREFGADHRLFQPLSQWDWRFGTPLRALLVQGGISLGLIIGIGSIWDGNKAFDKAVVATAAVFWLFFALTGAALFALRAKDRDIHRPFRTPLYPWLPTVFVAMCVGMIVGAILEEALLSLFGALLLVAGLPFYYWPRRSGEAHAQPQPLEPQPVGERESLL